MFFFVLELYAKVFLETMVMLWKLLFLIYRFETEPSLLSKYRYNIRAKTEPNDKNCDNMCKKTTLCSVTNVITSHYAVCLEDES